MMKNEKLVEVCAWVWFVAVLDWYVPLPTHVHDPIPEIIPMTHDHDRPPILNKYLYPSVAVVVIATAVSKMKREKSGRATGSEIRS
jgi:hypothetical protein